MTGVIRMMELSPSYIGMTGVIRMMELSPSYRNDRCYKYDGIFTKL